MIDPLVSGVWMVDTTTGVYELTIEGASMHVRTLPDGESLALEHAGGATALHSGDRLTRTPLAR